MVFTHRHIQPPPLKFGEFSLPPSPNTKYLGIIFDSKLLFSDHLKKGKKSGDQTVAQLIRISRCSFGIGLQQSRNLTISVLRSRILYGSMIWASEKNHKQVKFIVDKIENQANRMILGTFRTTPCYFLKIESPLIPFFDMLKRKNLLYFAKKLTALNHQPIKRLLNSKMTNQPSSHLSPIHNMLDQQSLTRLNTSRIETIHHRQIHPWESFNLEINNMKIKKENAKDIVTNQIN
ncbi:hypothetical protein PGT21_036504 [Puccinia graminis f. sp. tritici]|uniref:Uncharacterized protein n=1 Tax=Puccinia graminis f. sp. tritici TaxID=56615 RepID=A0A5B0Q063_PUCGR|nr:hypothetical protein PGT21_036504 [Puccinia graminis f. sp. tritici]